MAELGPTWLDWSWVSAAMSLAGSGLDRQDCAWLEWTQQFWVRLRLSGLGSDSLSWIESGCVGLEAADVGSRLSRWWTLGQQCSPGLD